MKATPTQQHNQESSPSKGRAHPSLWDSFKDDVFRNKAVIITGGGTGIGKLTTEAFVKYGAQVLITSRSEEHLEEAKKDILSRHPSASIFVKVCDIRKDDQVREMVQYAFEKMKNVDILINNSGANFMCPAKDVSANGWRTIVDICLTGTFLVSRHTAAEWIKRKTPGTIIMMAATNAHNGSPLIVASGAAKAGMISLAETLAVEWGRYGIKVNCISPGSVLTDGSSERLWENLRASGIREEDMTSKIPLGRYSYPEDVVGAVLFLASPAAAFISGADPIIDGGQRLSLGLMSAF